jgi:hypothetical protein
MRSTVLVVGGTWRMSLNGRLQSNPPALLGTQSMVVVGGGLLQPLGLAILPFTFQVTAADLMV